MRKLGAPAALQGYRLQAIYTLTRIFQPGVHDTQVFQPEGTEDLDILDITGMVTEAIQVKTYSGLVLSDLEPEKERAFFRRAANLLQSNNPPSIKLVNFGAIGPELKGAWEGHSPHRESVVSKLLDKGFTRGEIDGFFRHVELVSLTEGEAHQTVLDQIRRLSTGVDPKIALDLFVAWYLRLAERREAVSCAELLHKVNAVSRFLAERYHYHQEWHSTIEPLEASPIERAQLSDLRDRFYAGVHARYEHIVAGLDFERAHKVGEIFQAFHQKNVVIVHAASGQGKSTLAYRYLHDRYPEKWRFEIKRVQDVKHALSIGAALSGFATAVQVPIAVYIDVDPRDTEWPELVSRLSREPLLQVLVTIREEDYRRANVSGADFDLAEVSLDFDRAEAQLLYNRARSTGGEWQFLDFDAAWDAFDQQGPLLEFIYLLTQTETLRQRLKGQVDRIEAEVRRGEASRDELRLLSLVAVTSAHGARLRTCDVVATLDLPAPNRTLRQFEHEYLLRRTTGGMYLEGLHTIRSSILSDLLIQHDVNPWLETAVSALPLMPEEDLEAFILRALVDEGRQADRHRLLDRVMSLQPSTWTGIAGVLRSLLWADSHEYALANCEVLDAVHEEFGSAWLFVLDFDFTVPGEGPDLSEWWTKLGSLVPDERKAKIKAFRETQTPKETLFRRSREWLRSLRTPPRCPSVPKAWRDVAETWYWARRLASGKALVDWVTDGELETVVEDLPLAILADLSVAFHAYAPGRYQRWFEVHRDVLHRRLASEQGIVALEEADELLKIHFICSDKGVGANSDPLHAQTMANIELVRGLFPSYQRYASQGYGFRIAGVKLPQGDSTRKDGIPATSLPPRWPIWLNSVVGGIGRLRYRPDSWDGYLETVLERRRSIANRLGELSQGLIRWYQRSKPGNVVAEHVDMQAWRSTWEALSGPTDLPKVAVDPWGLGSESSAAPAEHRPEQQRYVPQAIALQKYKPYLEVQRGYFSSISSFLNQAPAIWITNAIVGRLHPDDPRRQAILEALNEQGVKPNRSLGVHTLFDSNTRLRAYQECFKDLFGSYLDEAEIGVLEDRESEVLTLTWTLWYYYTCKPWMKASSPRGQVRQWMDRTRREVKSRIQQALQTTQTPDCNTRLLDCHRKWYDSPALWVTFDFRDPTQLHTSILEAFPRMLREALGDVQFGSLNYYIIQEICQYIVIIPLVRGRMLDESVWPFHTMSILRTKHMEQELWAYFPQELPESVREEIDVEAWKLPEISAANQLSRSIATLYLLAAQVAEFRALPELTEPGIEALQVYLREAYSETMSIALQGFLDAAEELCEQSNALSDVEQQGREQLRVAIKALGEVHDDVRPGEGDGTFVLDVEGTAAYSQRLEEAYPIIEQIRLFWISDILDRMGWAP